MLVVLSNIQLNPLVHILNILTLNTLLPSCTFINPSIGVDDKLPVFVCHNAHTSKLVNTSVSVGMMLSDVVEKYEFVCVHNVTEFTLNTLTYQA